MIHSSDPFANLLADEYKLANNEVCNKTKMTNIKFSLAMYV